MASETALNFLPQDQLTLAYSQEAQELCRYRSLALCFLTFDTPISQLMNAIGIECEHRLNNLKEVAAQMAFDLPLDSSKLIDISAINQNSRHFFVVDENRGSQLLIDAEEAAKASSMIFSKLLKINAAPELRQLLTTFVKQKKSEYRVLKECREQWKLALHDLGRAS